jgi:branched-chain amino acid transport system permease protein
VTYFIEQAINALSLGGTYALLALGLAVVFSILGLINFAHGAMMTLTGYVMVFLTAAGLPIWLAMVFALVAVMVASVVMEWVAFRPVRGADGATLLLTSFAVAVLIQLGFQLFVSTRPQVVPLPAFLSSAFEIGGVTISVNRVLSIVVALAMVVLLNLFLRKTIIGLAMRAAAENFSVVRLMGVWANAVISAAFAAAGLLAGIAAILWISQRASVDPLMGLVPVLKAFIATILGGLGSLNGAIAGGFVLGAIEVLLSAYLPDSLLPYHGALTLAVVIAILIVRPNGLFGARSA